MELSMPEPWATLVGGLYAAFVGYAVSFTMFELRGRRVRKGDRWSTAELGFVERIVYTGAAVIGAWEVIAGWLVLKVGSGWRSWQKDAGTFNRFATGTGLNVAFGVAGGLMVKPLESGDLVNAATMGAIPLLMCLWVSVYARSPWLRKALDPEARAVENGTAVYEERS
jgi:hypothetical protein